ncbi:hypothetical protein MCP_0951 [Methanocella paludicola SANAE]|uniref:Glycosyltransferase 2-like domain-containing protein n=1 Tax=Methanocella paludicola (strain DSM 17711 / JCM 13418 / NBRC 101707 / SANAE) TaxID=304371 RepID=D1YX51_METPS|nr:glycosyltransferase [Methanocella paludicola]BAI61023.1 hypothetical protein MCP_0951 [Methanocella paludicola SANAE]
MDLSIVIRCGDDRRVFDCINSIDEHVGIIVALSENAMLQKELEEKKIKYCITPRHNLSQTSNIGIDKAIYEKVILTDSDTQFEPGCIRELYHALDQYPIARARINFETDSDKYSSRLVSEARDYVNSLPVVYTPGIAFRKSIVKHIGGFMFNDLVPYAVDADLNYRLGKTDLPVKFIDNLGLKHNAESMRHDLKAAFRIGRGCAISYLSLRRLKQYSSIRWYDLKGVKLQSLGDVLMKKGLIVALYQVIWDAFYWTGYAGQRLRGV